MLQWERLDSRPACARSRPNIEPLPLITITRDGALYLNEKAVSINVLADQLKRDFPMASEVYVKPDRMRVWEPVSQVLVALNAAKPPIQVTLAPGRPTSYQTFRSSHYRTWQLQTE